MTAPANPESDDHRILILAPTGNDANLTAEFLEESGRRTEVVGTMGALCEEIEKGCGAIVVAEEALNPTNTTQLFEYLKRQPSWSDLPVTLITTASAAAAARMRRIAALGSNSNITVLERPFRPGTLVSTMEVALRARARQYQVRELLRELSEARDQAERASSAKDEFLAALSHELRTPLNPVLLLATESASDLSLPEQVRCDFDQIARNVTLEARLIDDLLDLTRITRGKLNLELRTVDVHAALHEALATTESDIRDKKLRLDLDLRASHCQIAADPVRLQQILWNVLKNAAKFTSAGGAIRIATSSDETAVEIRVTDTGVGMDPTELARVFEAFEQGNHSRPTSGHRFGGLGLGLAISRMLVRAQGGQIEAGSAGPGKGSTFTMRFPLSKPAAAAPCFPNAGGSRSPNAESRRLLLVEDHRDTRISLSRMLERRGYEVATAASLAEARSLLRENSFDILLSDIGLPDGSGHDLMAELRDQPGITGIALSGFGMETDLASSRESGFVAHLTKPVSIDALEGILSTYVRPPAMPSRHAVA